MIIKKIVSVFVAVVFSLHAQANVDAKPTSIKIDAYGKTVDLPVTDRDGELVFGGDVVVRPKGASQALGIARWRRWPNGIIPYRIDPNHPFKREIERAISTLNSQTVLWFKPTTDYSSSYISIVNSNRCYSNWAGEPFFGDGYTVEIGAQCGYGGAIHELLHTAGVMHEHSRFDRDEYVRVSYDNVVSDRRADYDKLPNAFELFKNINKYDYDSIMHYPCTGDAAKDSTKPVIESATRPVGQRSGLSDGDIAGIASMYYGVSSSRGKPSFPVIDRVPLDFSSSGCPNVPYNPIARCYLMFDEAKRFSILAKATTSSAPRVPTRPVPGVPTPPPPTAVSSQIHRQSELRLRQEGKSIGCPQIRIRDNRNGSIYQWPQN
jgi:Astacin (Peptidase family M12A)